MMKSRKRKKSDNLLTLKLSLYYFPGEWNEIDVHYKKGTLIMNCNGVHKTHHGVAVVIAFVVHNLIVTGLSSLPSGLDEIQPNTVHLLLASGGYSDNATILMIWMMLFFPKIDFNHGIQTKL